METIRKFLAGYISQRGIKQSFIAKSTGISRNAVSKILNGERRIQADEFFSICRAVDMPQENINQLRDELAERK